MVGQTIAFGDFQILLNSTRELKTYRNLYGLSTDEGWAKSLAF